MAYPPSQDLRRLIHAEYETIDRKLDTIQQSIRGHRETVIDQSLVDRQRLNEIETLFKNRQCWMKTVSCLLMPCTFPIKRLCCEPCCSPCSEPTERKVDLCWHACNPDLYFDLDLERVRQAEGLPSAKEICLEPNEREELERLYENHRDIRLNREWTQVNKDTETLSKYRSGKL